jgi:hypothetical protein
VFAVCVLAFIAQLSMNESMLTFTNTGLASQVKEVYG